MITSYSSYIRDYVTAKHFANRPTPGEHHFVATYLVPKLFAIDGLVPDYINPDGTKAVLGDVVYYRDSRHHLGIEAKVEVIRLTTGEFNKWIVENELKQHPGVFICGCHRHPFNVDSFHGRGHSPTA